MNSKRAWIVFAVSVVVAAGIWKVWPRPDLRNDDATRPAQVRIAPSRGENRAQQFVDDSANAELHSGASDASRQVREAAAAVAVAQSPAEVRRILGRLRNYLVGLPQTVAADAVRDFLDDHDDVATKLEFTIAPDGRLKDAPTLRVWLLDCFGLVDRSAAADYARTILSIPESPDEWAVSLRDYALARSASEDVAFVQNKVRDMIHNLAWLEKPSAGFLEAFDVIVYTRATNLTPDLAELITRKDNRAVSHAAYLTLDRLVIEAPQVVLSQLADNPDAMRGREQTRANYFARADVREPEQLAVLESYMLDSHRTPEELHTFAGIYPSANFMISNNLLSKTNTPAQNDLAAHDREALQVVEGWLADPRFTQLKPELERIQARLSTFVQQAGSRENNQ
jgi:hypothetical protein